MSRHTGPYRIVLGLRLVEALPDVLRGVGAYAKERRLNWQLQCVDAHEFVPALAPGRCDGAITTIARRARDLIAAVKRTGVPVVNLLQDASPALPSVRSDDVAIGRMGGEYLLGRGFRHFAYLGFDTTWSHGREAGFAAAVARAGHACLTCDRFANVSDFRRISAPRAIRELRGWVTSLPRPVGIMACSDLIATSLLAACASAGVRVPDEAAVLGVDNLVATCELAPVALSSVAQDFRAMGFEAARLLHGLILRGQRSHPGRRARREGRATRIASATRVAREMGETRDERAAHKTPRVGGGRGRGAGSGASRGAGSGAGRGASRAEIVTEGGGGGERLSVIAPGGVVVRRSTDVLAFEDEHVAAAMRLIHEHAAEGLRMKELLRGVPVSRRWLDARFKAVVGRTASAEIRRLRLARIRDLLEQTDLSVKQVALRCGFSRAENLIRFFRDACGAPPQQYRARHAHRPRPPA